MNNTPQTLKGFRDFLPEVKRKRDWVQHQIVDTFKIFGFEPLETPTLEYSSLLLGKYGQEADKLLYTFTDKGNRQVGLRYDQTVPTARVIGQHFNQLPKFFRRYQIQNVFRADKPQRGRYREFTQCDCDIFGSNSILADAEILAVFFAIYQRIGVKSIKIQINDRKSLVQTFSPFATDQCSVFSIIQTLDKLDKLTPDQITQELLNKGQTPQSVSAILESLHTTPVSDQLNQIINAAVSLGVAREALQFNPRIARGLDYYTGLIFEGTIPEYSVGSIGGGGRYDHLIKDLTNITLPAVGFGLGFDRTIEAADQLGLIPSQTASAQVLVAVFNDSSTSASLNTASQLRQAGISTEVYPAFDKLGNQFKLANDKHIPFVIIIGEEEFNQNKIKLKNMATGTQHILTLEQTLGQLKNLSH